MQCLRRAADLGRDRRDRRPSRGVLAFVIQHDPNRAVANLRRKLVGRLACHGSTFSGVGASDQPGRGSVDIVSAAPLSQRDVNGLAEGGW